MISPNEERNINIILEILKDEVGGNIQGALDKLHKDYSMTWVYKRRDGVLFPNIVSQKIKEEIVDVYKIKGREYKIKHIIAQDDVVMAELVESYPDLNAKKTYFRTPMVIVWEFENGKIKTGRHYCDPQLSYEKLDEDQIKSIYK